MASLILSSDNRTTSGPPIRSLEASLREGCVLAGFQFFFFSCHTHFLLVRLTGIEDTPREQHGVGLPVSDEEEEGVVGLEDLRFRGPPETAEGHPHRGGGGGLG